MSERTSIEPVSYVAGESRRRAVATPEEARIRKWLAGLFVQSIKAGERLLENGNVAQAAALFANATLLTDRPKSFVAAVRQVYPNYFYRLFERRLLTMGYRHLFTGADAKSAGVHRSPPPTRQQ